MVGVFWALSCGARVATQAFLIRLRTLLSTFEFMIPFYGARKREVGAAGDRALARGALYLWECTDAEPYYASSASDGCRRSRATSDHVGAALSWLSSWHQTCAKTRAKTTAAVSARVPRLPSTKKVCADSHKYTPPGRLSGYDHARRYHIPTVRAR